MPCLLVIVAVFLPRVALVVIWLFSFYLERAYDSIVWPVLGFLFMPYTTLAYAFAVNSGHGLRGMYLLLLIVAVILDISSLGGGGHSYRGRRRRR